MPVVERLAWRWVIFNEFAAEDTSGEPRNRVLYYEELCASPESVTRGIFDFCALGWSEQTAQFLHSSTTRSRDDYYSVFKDPLASAWRWQSELSAEDAAIVARVTADSAPARPYFAPSAWNASSSTGLGSPGTSRCAASGCLPADGLVHPDLTLEAVPEPEHHVVAAQILPLAKHTGRACQCRDVRAR